MLKSAYHKCRSGEWLLQHSYSFCPLSLSYFSYSWKTFKNSKNSIISFVDDSLFISQKKSSSHSNAIFFYSYNVFSFLLTKFGLVVEHGKTKMFHFSGLYGAFNPPQLNLTTLGDPILLPKASWQYLGFFFDQELTFQHHIEFYTNKLISTIKCMKILENSSRKINPLQKRRLYRCCTLPIALYSFSL